MKRKYSGETYISEDEDRISDRYRMDRNTYLDEICAMMHAFGDVKEPKEKSVLLMRAILRDQMNLLLLEAENTAYIRKGQEISHEDILFIMRKNKMKLKRLLEYLHILDMKPGLNNLQSEYSEFYDLKLKGKRYKMCLEFLALIEDCNEFTSVMQDNSIIDISALKRKMRRYWTTHMMNTYEYQEFIKASQASFRPMKKFKEWLLQDQVTDLNVTNIALAMINFLARETIAELVDMVLLMKMKKLGKNQHLQYEYFANSVHFHIKSELNLETIETSNEVNSETAEPPDKVSNGNKLNGDCSTSTSTKEICTTYEKDSEDQVTFKMDENFKGFAYEGCREKNIAPIEMNEDSNGLNLDQSDLLSRCSSKSQDDDILQLGETGCDSRGARTSGSESNVELRSDLPGYYEIIDDSEDPNNKSYLNEASNEAESNSCPIEFEKSPEEVPSNPLLNEKFEVWSDVSDEHVLYVPECAQKNMSNICPKIISELSNNPGDDHLSSIHDGSVSQNLLFNRVFSSERIFQGTPVAGSSAQSQECLVDMSDTSDHEHFSYEIMKSCDHKKLPKRKISLSNHSKKTLHQIEPIIDTSATTNHLSVAAKNEVTYLTAIEPVEITEAFARFQEPLPLVMIFAVDQIPRKTKLICLAESLSFDI